MVMETLSFDKAENEMRIRDLIDRISTEKNVILFAGAGISLAPPANMPSAWELKLAVLEALAPHLEPDVRELIFLDHPKSRKLSLRGHWRDLPSEVLFHCLKQNLGSMALEPLRLFGPSDSRHNHNHLTLALLGEAYCPIILTTNFDLLVESALRATSLDHLVLCFASKDDPFRLPAMTKVGEFALLVKLHGSIDSPETLITTFDDAGEFLPEAKSLVMRDACRGKVVCLVGYSANDFDIFQALKELELDEIWSILRPPADGRPNPRDFGRHHVHIFELLEMQDRGVPVVYDLVAFFDLVCTSLFPDLHSRHSALSTLAHTKHVLSPSFSAAISSWAEKITSRQAHGIIGDVYHYLGRGKPAATIFNRLLSSGSETLPPSEEAILRIRLSAGLERAHSYQQAIREADEAVRLARGTNSQFLLAQALYSAGNARWVASGGLSLRGVLQLLRAERLYRTLPGSGALHGRGAALQHLYLSGALVPPIGPLRWFVKRMVRGLEWSYSMFQGPNGNALRLIGRVYANLGEYELGLERAKAGENICVWYKDYVGIANCRRDLGRIWIKLDDLEQAKQCYEEALETSKTVGDTAGLMKARLALGDIARREAQADQAITCYEEAWNVFKTVGIGNLRRPDVLLKLMLTRLWTVWRL